MGGPSYGIVHAQFKFFVACGGLPFRQVFSVKCFPCSVERIPSSVFRRVCSSEIFVEFDTVGFSEDEGQFHYR